ncbi:MAG: trimethylamine methyltransferase family protein, partial [Proteobacteria bacterium]|nr:trimethylamine methyltransferase family protein [Pseudomonadota bacterium]
MSAESLRPRRRQPRPEAPRPEDPGLHQGLTAPYDPLAPAVARRLIDAALTLLADVGVAFDVDTEAPGLFKAGGCDVAADGVVRIPRAVAEATLASVAKQARLWNRDGTHSILLDCQHTWFFPGMTCIKVYDLATGERRESTAEDLATITRVA